MSVNAHIRAFSHALQFLTRLPAPPIAVFDPADLSRSALWFPAIGALIGRIVAAALWAGALASPWIGALLALVAWVWVTGGLHLDGLADVADALGAAHRSPERFIEVLRDPHIGAYGTMAIVPAAHCQARASGRDRQPAGARCRCPHRRLGPLGRARLGDVSAAAGEWLG